MGKNYKEKCSYYYLHDIKDIPFKMYISLKHKWNRHNFDLDEMRYLRNKKRIKILNNQLKNEINNYD